MPMRPDPTFHASPKLAMEAPPENFAYTLLLSPDFSKPDALAVIDVKPGSPTFRTDQLITVACCGIAR
jgi:selenium-binding protein 1